MKLCLNTFSRDLLLFLIVIYFAQGALYPVGSVISKTALLSILIISSIYLVKSLIIKSEKDLFYYAWAIFLFLNFIGFIFKGNFDIQHTSQIRNILTVFLPFFPFYYFSYKGKLSKKSLLRFFVIFLPIVVASHYANINSILIERTSSNEDVVSNTSYFFVALIPYIFLWGKHKIASFLSIILIFFFIIEGSKRGALVAGIAGFLVYSYYQIININPKKRLQGYILTFTGFLIAMYVSYVFYLSNEYLVSRIKNEGDSGRELISSSLWNNWYNSDSIINYLFGFGFLSTIKYSGFGVLAHNDWLETLINFGLLGLSLYLLVFYTAIRFIINPKVNKESRFIMLTIVLMWFLQTLFSMYYTASYTVISSILMGYLIGTYHYNQRRK
ncbi:hypothetical protein [Psychrobacter immobilis]|uniref:hypothetical protein n=1 Tax=Psychrobacter immobilis TaxID=498 RepID=UPI0019194715|nr:hypothetical protein [Psychrobacter immobilis]